MKKLVALVVLCVSGLVLLPLFIIGLILLSPVAVFLLAIDTLFFPEKSND